MKNNTIFIKSLYVLLFFLIFSTLNMSYGATIYDTTPQTPKKSSGYYTVFDKYSNGTIVERGKYEINQPSMPRLTKISPPLGEKPVWIHGPASFIVYSSINTNNYTADNIYDTMLYYHNNGSGNFSFIDSYRFNVEEGEYDCTPQIVDYDYDGSQEIVSYNRTNQVLRLIDPRTGAEKKTLLTMSQMGFDSLHYFTFMNIDNDSYPELLIYGTLAGRDTMYVKFFDDFSSLSEMVSINLQVTKLEASQSTYGFFTGDMDNDSKTEFGYVQKYLNRDAVVHVYDDLENSLNHVTDITLSQEVKSIRGVWFENIDDNKNTTELLVDSSDLFCVYHIYLDTSSSELLGYAPSEGSDGKLYITNYYGTSQPNIVTIGRVNTQFWISVYTYSKGASELNHLNFVENYSDSVHTLPGSSSDTFYVDMIMDNFDLDPLYEFLVAYSVKGSVEVSGYFLIDDYVNSHKLISDLSYLPINIYETTKIFPYYSNGRMLVQYSKHNQSISQPYLIAAISAPPTVKGIKQNYAGSLTLFGKAVENSETTGNGYTISNSITLSYEKKDIFNLFDFEASLTLKREVSKTTTVTETIEQVTEFTGDYSSDYVIFETITYDNYYYEILIHPDREYVGQLIAINVPNQPQIYKWTIDYFNEQAGDNLNVFNHTIGDPTTYPGKQNKDQFKTKYKDSGYWESNEATIGSGYGTVAVQLTVSNTYTSEKVYTIGAEAEAGFKIAGVGLKTSIGLSSSKIYSVSIGRSTTYRGEIGDIGPEDYQEYKYSFGVFVYNYYDEQRKATYQVINYWIDNYEGTPKGIIDDFSNVVQKISQNPIYISAAAVTLILVAGLISKKLFSKPKKKPRTRRKKR